MLNAMLGEILQCWVKSCNKGSPWSSSQCFQRGLYLRLFLCLYSGNESIYSCSGIILILSTNLNKTPIGFDQAAHMMGEHLSPSPNKMDPIPPEELGVLKYGNGIFCISTLKALVAANRNQRRGEVKNLVGSLCSGQIMPNHHLIKSLKGHKSLRTILKDVLNKETRERIYRFLHYVCGAVLEVKLD